MKIKRLIIENFKSIEQIELIEPNPFTVFVGPNGSGKSNIFEALEFINYSRTVDDGLLLNDIFGGIDNFINRKATTDRLYFSFECKFETFDSSYKRFFNAETNRNPDVGGQGFGAKIYNDGQLVGEKHADSSSHNYHSFSSDNPLALADFNLFFKKFSRLFVGKNQYQKINGTSDARLSLSALNLEKVLGRLLNDSAITSEFNEWLSLFIPSFDKVEIVRNKLTGEDTLLYYDQFYDRPFSRELISDGTFNILALLTAVYQSEEPQFLCIEEPENGLHPQVLMTLVDFFRKQCEEKGHYIWLNTHSESLVRCLTTEEIVLVNKREGATQIRQIKDRNLYDMPTDEAWLTGALGGGLPW
ncbi:AAA family ATPase [Spirosoma fluviale]|uniref:Predicted ATPase n=1 Tax=Spirosoma fluviale TaxID=1597977 RepID=A0A286F7A2_9BACT|nr:AAA family ATPase [Spirosoma fluviale]SOD79107.1 Predicted ATPase [Spirosoma fluviale]